MSARLICLLNETPGEGELVWALHGGARQRKGSGDFGALLSDLESLGPDWLAAGGRIIGVLPGEACAVRDMPAPPKSEKKFRAAAGLLLEDELAEPVSDVHVAVAAATGVEGEETGAVFAVKSELIAGWTEAFKEAGFPLSILTIDFLCLAGDDAPTPALAFFKDRILWFDGARGFAAEVGLGGQLIELLLNAGHSGFQFYGSERLHGMRFSAYAEYKGEANENLLLKKAAAATTTVTPPVNLLQGRFRPQRRLSFDFGVWRRAGLLAASVALAMLALNLAEGRRAGALAARYEDEAARLHRENFPNAPTSNIRAQARAALATGGATSFADLSARLGVALAQSESVAINRVLYDAERGLYTFTIASESNSDIDAFRESLAGAGLLASDASGYRRSGDFWIGEMTARLQ